MTDITSLIEKIMVGHPPGAPKDREYFRKLTLKLLPLARVKEAAESLSTLADKWACEAYDESQFADLKSVLNKLAYAETHLHEKLTAND